MASRVRTNVTGKECRDGAGRDQLNKAEGGLCCCGQAAHLSDFIEHSAMSLSQQSPAPPAAAVGRFFVDAAVVLLYYHMHMHS